MKYGLTEETYNKIKKVIESNNKYIFKLFGSRARGDYKKNSDIDIAVFKNVPEKDEFKIKNEIDEIDIIYKIDLVFIKDKTKPELLKSIEKEGVEF